MFNLSLLEHVVRLPPWDFNKDTCVAIENELNKKLANRVLLNCGLCVVLHDIISIGDSFILPGDGASHTKIRFRYVTFRPFIDEVLVGRIRSSSRDGVYLTLGFFDDILIAPSALQEPSYFDETEQVWYWEYDTDDGKHKLFMDQGQQVRFRVTGESFTDTSPSRAVGGDMEADLSLAASAVKKTPYSIMATINEPGLGPLSWWDS